MFLSAIFWRVYENKLKNSLCTCSKLSPYAYSNSFTNVYANR